MQAINTVNGVATLIGFEGLFANALAAVFGLVGIALFIMLIVGGFKYITSGGDPKALESVKGTLTYSFLGMLLAVGAYLILVFIETVTGANVTVFRIGP